jgi:hypothetical protein
MRKLIALAFVLVTAAASRVDAFLEDICIPRTLSQQGVLSWCIQPKCPGPAHPNRACAEQTLEFATVKPGRSMVHMDSTYFIAQALGYRADVAYWIAAYNEVSDYTQYVPIDQCGVQASPANSGSTYITAQFNGFQRTNLNTDGPLDHYVVFFSPNGQGTDVHGAGGVQAIYPFHYPQPGYPIHIDDTYQKTLANMRAWGMLASTDPGLLCTVGLTNESACLTGWTITGAVPLIMRSQKGIKMSIPTGPKVLNYTANGNNPPAITYYDQLGTWLADPNRTTGTLWMAPTPVPVPVQVARIALYLHSLQDTSSHSTYCGDEAPSPPGGSSPGTYMYMGSNNQVDLAFGQSCASSPHLAGHVQETGTGDNPLPLRDYVALNNTVDELIVFGNEVASKQSGWIINPQLLPPDVIGGKNALGQSATDIKSILVGTIVSGTPYSRAEVYKSGAVTLPLQQVNALDRLHAMNSALATYSITLASRMPSGAKFTPLATMPGNSSDPNNKSACWQMTSTGTW